VIHYQSKSTHMNNQPGYSSQQRIPFWCLKWCYCRPLDTLVYVNTVDVGWSSTWVLPLARYTTLMNH